MAIFEAAVADPDDEDLRNAFLNILGKVGERYVVEGDILLSADQVREYLRDKQRISKDPNEKRDRSQELIVETEGDRNEQIIWKTLEARKLSYAIDRASFPSETREAMYQQVVNAMRVAGTAWNEACTDCQVEFRHVPAEDSDPSLDRVRFIVKYRKPTTFRDIGVVATAFFPNAAKDDRLVFLLDRFFLNSTDQVGTLTHELGHILGYRHEQLISTEPGCAVSRRDELKIDATFEPIDPTQKDPDLLSIMHSPCGSAKFPSKLSVKDIEQHRKIYGPKWALLDISVRSVNPAQGLGEVISKLHKNELTEAARFTEHTVDGSSQFILERILRKEIGLPGVTDKFVDALGKINSGVDLNALTKGTKLKIPKNFLREESTITFSKARLADYVELLGRTPDRLKSSPRLPMTSAIKSLVNFQDGENSRANGFLVSGRKDQNYIVTTSNAVSFVNSGSPGAVKNCAKLKRPLDIYASAYRSGSTKRQPSTPLVTVDCAYRLGGKIAFIPLDEDTISETQLVPLTFSNEPAVPGELISFPGVTDRNIVTKVEQALNEHRGTEHRGKIFPRTTAKVVSTKDLGELDTKWFRFVFTLNDYLAQLKRENNLEGKLLVNVEGVDQFKKARVGRPVFNDKGFVIGVLSKIIEGDDRNSDKFEISPIRNVKQSATTLITDGSLEDDRIDKRLRLLSYELTVRTNNVKAARQIFAELRMPEAADLGIQVVKEEQFEDSNVRPFSTNAVHAVYDDCTNAGTVQEKPYSELLPWLVGWTAPISPNQCDPTKDSFEIILLDQWAYLHEEFMKPDGSSSVRHKRLKVVDGKPKLVEVDAAEVSKHFESHRHKDQNFSASGSPMNPAVVGQPRHRCKHRGFARQFDHGTYLAGIIASQSTGKPGFSAILPNQELTSVLGPTKKVRYLKLLKRLNNNRESIEGIETALEHRSRIAIIASPFPPDDPSGIIRRPNEALEINYHQSDFKDARLKREKNRFRHPLAKWISGDADTLWVVAAGQIDKSGDNPAALEKLTPQTPQNLGDFEHIVVVTACERCEEFGKIQLVKGVNIPKDWDSGAVAIVAPGHQIPGPVAGSHYSVSGGTSPSAAFVASVAGAMTSCYPKNYINSPRKIKRRLSFTGRPYITVDSNPTSRIVEGAVVIDPQYAMLNPSEDWITRWTTVAATGEKAPDLPQKILLQSWCIDKLKVRDSDDRESDVEVDEILRMTQVDDNSWALFLDGDTGHTGPFSILNLSDETPIIQTKTEVVKFGELHGILLARTQDNTSICSP